MILIVFAIMLVLGVFLSKKYYCDDVELLGWFIEGLSGFALAISLIVVAVNYITADATASRMSAQRESLVYQAEMRLYDNDNDFGKKELVDQITEWNADLAENKKLQRNLWIGCYVPNIYDQFEEIPMEIIGGSNDYL